MTQPTTASKGTPATPGSLDALAEAQGVRPASSFESICGGWPEEELEDGFEEAVRRWRNAEIDTAG